MPFPPDPIGVFAGPEVGPAEVPGGEGSPGGGATILGAVPAGIQGFVVAFNDNTLTETPAWTRLDDPSGPFIVQGFTSNRGRSYEFDRTDTGTATVRIVDHTGEFDPTNAASGFNGKLEPLKQAALAVYNPISGEWSTVYRGFISAWRYMAHPTLDYLMVDVDLVDAMDVLAAAELVPDGTYGHEVADGNIVYWEDLATNAVETRIHRVLTEVGFPVGTGLREIFTGNVKLQRTVYPPRASALSVIQDAADAEFPGVANFFVAKDGKVTFHGRLARFNPTDSQYRINTWKVGDRTAVLADSTVAPMVEPFEYTRDKENVFTAALSTPQGVADADIATNYVTDASSITERGRRTWSAENLETAGGAGTTALVETKKFATYYVDNYKTPRNRVRQITVKAASTTGTGVSAAWDFVCGVDISDRVLLTTTHVGGGGFNEHFFVEGVHTEVKPLNATHMEVTVTVDVSPASLYTSNPF